MTDRGAAFPFRSVPRHRAGGIAMTLAMVLSGAVAGLSGSDPARAAATDAPASSEHVERLAVAPLVATINAAAFRPVPADATFVVQRYDDSSEHETIARALSQALGRTAGPGATGLPLELVFDVYVIRSGVPVLAMDLLETEDRRAAAAPEPERRPGIDVTELKGRGRAVEGNVFHQRNDSFSATLRLKITVSDPMTGSYLWRGWADSSMNGLSRAQVSSLLADPLVATMGQTVADRAVRLQVPADMGGAPPDQGDQP